MPVIAEPSIVSRFRKYESVFLFIVRFDFDVRTLNRNHCRDFRYQRSFPVYILQRFIDLVVLIGFGRRIVRRIGRRIGKRKRQTERISSDHAEFDFFALVNDVICQVFSAVFDLYVKSTSKEVFCHMRIIRVYIYELTDFQQLNSIISLSVAEEGSCFGLIITVVSIVLFNGIAVDHQVFEFVNVVDCVFRCQQSRDLVEVNLIITYIPSGDKDRRLLAGILVMLIVKDLAVQLIVGKTIPLTDLFQCVAGICCVTLLSGSGILCDTDHNTFVIAEETFCIKPAGLDCLQQNLK